MSNPCIVLAAICVLGKGKIYLANESQ
jgi:hypothetical protein